MVTNAYWNLFPLLAYTADCYSYMMTVHIPVMFVVYYFYMMSGELVHTPVLGYDRNLPLVGKMSIRRNNTCTCR